MQKNVDVADGQPEYQPRISMDSKWFYYHYAPRGVGTAPRKPEGADFKTGQAVRVWVPDGTGWPWRAGDVADFNTYPRKKSLTGVSYPVYLYHLDKVEYFDEGNGHILPRIQGVNWSKPERG